MSLANHSDPTRQSLLAKIRDVADTEAWHRYWNTYLPKIRKSCASAGLRGADLDEVISMVLAQVVAAMRKGWVYDPRRTYRGWLWTVCQSQIRKFRRQEARPAAKGTGDSKALAALHDLPAPADAATAEDEFAALVDLAVQRVRDELGESSVKWQCFDLKVLQRVKGEVVADRLRIKVGLVHQNKSRVALAIRQEVEKLRDER
jgi:DNA-directed RNA polymerase specialized sigma24 family protein